MAATTVEQAEAEFFNDLATAHMFFGLDAELVQKELLVGPIVPEHESGLFRSAAGKPLSELRRAVAGTYPLLMMAWTTPLSTDLSAESMYERLHDKGALVVAGRYSFGLSFTTKPHLETFVHSFKQKLKLQLNAGRRWYYFGPAKQGELLVNVTYGCEPMPARKRD